jgi:hypothetical protein
MEFPYEAAPGSSSSSDMPGAGGGALADGGGVLRDRVDCAHSFPQPRFFPSHGDGMAFARRGRANKIARGRWAARKGRSRLFSNYEFSIFHPQHMARWAVGRNDIRASRLGCPEYDFVFTDSRRRRSRRIKEHTTGRVVENAARHLAVRPHRLRRRERGCGHSRRRNCLRGLAPTRGAERSWCTCACARGVVWCGGVGGSFVYLECREHQPVLDRRQAAEQVGAGKH